VKLTSDLLTSAFRQKWVKSGSCDPSNLEIREVEMEWEQPDLIFSFQCWKSQMGGNRCRKEWESERTGAQLLQTWRMTTKVSGHHKPPLFSSYRVWRISLFLRERERERERGHSKPSPQGLFSAPTAVSNHYSIELPRFKWS